MADTVVNETLANITAAANETAKNATGRAAATPEGLVTAYCGLIIMALLPIFFGSFRSVRAVIQQKVSSFNPHFLPRNLFSSLNLHKLSFSSV